ncbi:MULTISPECIES: DUF3140 domain-containing protein [Streptomyces]|uniref:DUF3140 domain-containing protein n=1 Tax=Streptomyces lycii TaxID=2654337 RepID=A0ABQ7FGM4_9ACTN|nr:MULTISPECIES: DUF3140 domain-containing protein [Streptomyces]KAF4407519.1 DUF3140 domain-containing protein [Streptomyces lycii]PGH52232.1 DNA-binding protein [Streptomyces sp. Ru87]
MDTEEQHATRQEFHRLVNLTPAALEKWLATDASREAGLHPDGGESVGHASGRRIVELLRTKKADLSDSDYEHMRKVVGYIHRHLAQRPSGNTEDSRWRHSLMNWGHDPLER